MSDQEEPYDDRYDSENGLEQIKLIRRRLRKIERMQAAGKIVLSGEGTRLLKDEVRPLLKQVIREAR